MYQHTSLSLLVASCAVAPAALYVCIAILLIKPTATLSLLIACCIDAGAFMGMSAVQTAAIAAAEAVGARIESKATAAVEAVEAVGARIESKATAAVEAVGLRLESTLGTHLQLMFC